MLRLSGQMLDGRELMVRIAATMEPSLMSPEADIISNDALRRGSAFHATDRASTTEDYTAVQAKISNSIEDNAKIPQIKSKPPKDRNQAQGEVPQVIAERRRARVEGLSCDVTEQKLRDYLKDYAL